MIVKHIKRTHEARKSYTLFKVEEAIKRQINDNESINFNCVSIGARVSKATLYRNPNIREQIESLRQQQDQVSTPAQIKVKMLVRRMLLLPLLNAQLRS